MPILTLCAVQSQIASCMPEALKAEAQTKFAAEGYALAGTQVVCNPRSYPGEATRFDPWSLLRGEHRADSEGLADSNCTAHNRHKVKPDGGAPWRVSPGADCNILEDLTGRPGRCHSDAPCYGSRVSVEG